MALLLEALSELGYRPHQAYLFGSVVSGQTHAYSDIDLALWDEHFSGCLTIDYEPIKHILTKFPLIELHTFSKDDDEKTSPWVKEILKKGTRIDLNSLSLQHRPHSEKAAL